MERQGGKMRTTAVLAVVAVLGLLACEAGQAEIESADAVKSAAQELPAMLGGSCPAPPPDEVPVPFCDWVGAPDAVFSGTLVDVKLARDIAVRTVPAASGGPEQAWEQVDCAAEVAPAVVLTIATDTVLAGELPGQVEVRIGYYRLDYFSAFPDETAGGEVVWIPRMADDQDPAAILQTGKPVGVLAYFLDDYDAWSVLGERLFMFQGADDDPTIVVQRDSCARELEVEGMTLSEVVSRARVCQAAPRTPEAQARRSLMFRGWGPAGPNDDGTGDPRNSVAGSCSLAMEDHTGEQCAPETVEEDCAQPSVCLHGHCYLLR